ncbi:MAG: DUF3575 domain-containing protein [Bacteroidales bacterium]
MRKFNLLLILSITFLYAVAQDQGEKQVTFLNSIKVNPLRFVSSTFHMSYERLIGKDKSLNLSAGLTYKDSENESVSGYRGEIQFRYFVLQHKTDEVCRKLYFAPFAFDQYTDVTDHNYYDPYNLYPSSQDNRYFVNSFGAGLVAGLNMIFAKRFVLDAFVGGGVRTSNMDRNSSTFLDNSLMGYGYKGIFPRIGFDIGFTF